MSDPEVDQTANPDTLSTFFGEGLSEAKAGSVARFPAEEVAHLRTARFRPGDRLAVTDGVGRRWEAELLELDRRRANCRLVRSLVVAPRSPVHLWAPVGNRDRALWLVEKSVELGVTALTWVDWGRSRSVGDAGRSDAFLHRAEARARAALKQSGGSWLPSFAGPVDLAAGLASVGAGSSFLGDEAGTPALRAFLGRIRGGCGGAGLFEPLRIAIGPEGGLTETERRMCVEAGFEPVSLGASTLRFETAAVAAVTLALAAFDREREAHE